ncbi:histidine kinase [Canicola haemoglobinophilus]|uniref:Signal-transduction protein n=1 Tax=Canicola haemoglobinophilus TaxID=733 RepID=A0A1V4B4B9_9PAST|nr:DUF294 nucleotidyltransferase-like domain-containing protein [Canicola haemoglobinophilus]OOS02439.1 histidine kinase [Canicola haemoglobinophilus]STO59281.1 signal-transduction protein [Canicola haemoglobinophilus]
MDSSLIPNIELFIAQVPPFTHLPQDLIRIAAQNIEIRYIPKGELITNDQTDSLNNNENLYIVRMGAVEQVNKSGQLRARLESGDCFGFSIFNHQEQDKYQAYALENTLIYQIPFQRLNELLKQFPEYASYFSTDAGKRLNSLAKNNFLKNQNDIFMKKVIDIANPKIALVDANTTLQQAAIRMCEQRRSSALVMQENKLIGIIHDRDMTKKVVAQGLDVNTLVTEIMSLNPPVISGNELVLNAVSMMMQHNIRSLPVMLDDKVQGILTATDLVKQNSIQSVFIINRIFQANTLPLLVEIAKQQQDLFQALLESGVAYSNIMHVMTLIADAFARKLLMMAEHKLGKPPCRYAWFVAGSQARYEMHPLSDQDNGIILEKKLTALERKYFAQLTDFVNEGLRQCGYPYCTGHYMASNPRWRVSLTEWRANFRSWIVSPELEGLLNASVFMDMRGIYGDLELVDGLQQYFVDLVANNKRFLAFLVANSIRVKPPLSIFRNFVLVKEGEHKNKLNLKKRAISLLVDLARIYALAAGLPQTMSTEQRFEHCYKQGILNKETLDNALEVYQFVCDMRFKYQAEAWQQQQELTNHIDPSELSALERNHLKDAFRLIAKFQEAAELRFSQRGIMR